MLTFLIVDLNGCGDSVETLSVYSNRRVLNSSLISSFMSSSVGGLDGVFRRIPASIRASFALSRTFAYSIQTNYREVEAACSKGDKIFYISDLSNTTGSTAISSTGL